MKKSKKSIFENLYYNAIASEWEYFFENNFDDYYVDLFDEENEYEKEMNSKNKYGLSDNQIITLTRRHKRARKDEDYRTMAKIEYRLTDINFHWECGKMYVDKYVEIFDKLKGGWQQHD